MSSTSRERMVATAASMIGSRGVKGTSFSEVLAASQAPRGSIYHHFPAGKRQLVAEAVRRTTGLVLAHQRSCSAETPAGILDHFVSFFRQALTASRCQSGCPVAGVVLDSYAEQGQLLGIVRRSFRSWVTLLTAQLVAAGMTREGARALSVTALASIEGGLLLCRAEGDVEPLNVIERHLRSLARASLPRGR
ncbi:MAG: TetR/AcrR family transcriptional regulator [Thermoplasmata archaeon]|nr:TetR/AcrR family transcriptional regulator [Thermoplasmata archaeon]